MKENIRNKTILYCIKSIVYAYMVIQWNRKPKLIYSTVNLTIDELIFNVNILNKNNTVGKLDNFAQETLVLR